MNKVFLILIILILFIPIRKYENFDNNINSEIELLKFQVLQNTTNIKANTEELKKHQVVINKVQEFMKHMKKEK